MPRQRPHPRPSAGCIECHAGIEQMHPWSPVTCVDCHGGNGAATTAGRARRALEAARERRARRAARLRPRLPALREPDRPARRAPDLRAVPRGDGGRVQDLAPRHDRGPPLGRPLRERRREEEGHVVRDLPDGRTRPGSSSAVPASSRRWRRRHPDALPRRRPQELHAMPRVVARPRRARAARHGRRLPLRGLRRRATSPTPTSGSPNPRTRPSTIASPATRSGTR